MPYGITQCYLPPVSGEFPAFTQPKLVLDLATPEECKAELSWLAVTPQDRLPAKDGHLSQKNNQAVSWPGIEPATKSCESSVVTTRPPSHLKLVAEVCDYYSCLC